MSHPVPPAGDTAYAPAARPPAANKKQKILVRILIAVVVAIAVFALKGVFFGGDSTGDAKAGDCISSDKAVSDEGTTETGADVVECSSGDAAFTVVARVDGESSPQSKSCDKFFQPSEEFFVFASNSGDGYVLCLRPRV